MGKRPEVRGAVMNPVDHPHGGGEGKAPVGHAGPMTPWGKPALGYKTRKKKINNLINLLLREENKIYIRKTISLRIYLKNKVNLKICLPKLQ